MVIACLQQGAKPYQVRAGREFLVRMRRKLAAARTVESLPLVPLLVTHFAHPGLLAQAEQERIIVVQGFEW